MAVVFLAVLTILVAGTVTVVTSRAPANSQAVSWSYARYAAEAGVDLAVSQLKNTIPAGGPTSGSANLWNGWVLATGTAASGTNLLISSTATIGPTTVLTGSNILYTGTLFSSSLSGSSAYANVSVQSLAAGGTGVSNYWYKIRSIGTAPVYGPPISSIERWDSDLRRPNLYAVRVTLSGTDTNGHFDIPLSRFYPPWWGATKPWLSAPSASVSRVIEVLVKTVTGNSNNPFTFGIYTQTSMQLGNGNYSIDSWNSDPPNTTGTFQYPGGTVVTNTSSANYATSPHAGGDIGTNGTGTPSIYTDGSTVYGSAQTLSGSAGVDSPSNVTDGVSTMQQPVPMSVPVAPDTTGWAAATSTMNVNGTAAYYANSDPGSITFTGTGNVTLVINSSWSIGNGKKATVVVPQGVYATVYVAGSIDFGNGSVNTGSASSNIPSHLIIYGTAPAALGATAFSGNGNPTIAAAFYGPTYDVTIKGGGNGAFYGSIIANSFQVSGGGNSAFHYDEALRNLGNGSSTVTDFQMTSYFEDSRR